MAATTLCQPMASRPPTMIVTHWASLIGGGSTNISPPAVPATSPNPPRRPDPIPLGGAGDSAAGLAHAGKIVDGYLTMLRGVERIRAQFDAARASAASQGRVFAELGALASVIVRATRGEAEAHFYAMFEQTGVATMVAKLDEAVRRRTKGEHILASFRVA